MRLEGKVAVVTAAGAGIGQAAVLALAREGAQVWATDVKPELLKSFEGVANVQTAPLDVMNRAAIDGFFAGLPRVDVLFNCAGFVHNGTILEASDEDWDFAFDLNVRSMFWTIRAALPAMLKNGGGSIVNMASVASSIRGLPNRFVYGASKAAVIGLTKAVAADYVLKGIRCNAISPGTVDTPSLQQRINAYDDPVAARAAFVARQPMGRIARADEIAPIVTFLASDDAAFVTGQTYSVDGGMTI
ncbi:MULTISPECIES: SDR family oxidoreductase [Burkholderia]|jgi:2-keto-3-deoxy-L-fuconate dehydrogenase|uniref:3-hydroxybutyrate dehydrogenase type 2 n=2 Tax=Burkholderia gladioli TaxID=28095 RepID=A0A095FE55_BURGA|nr:MULTISPECIES: SDR family oxidoreductase [Burkholderia]AEA63404.1 Short-chain dehydrogenase/reductase SDR [Burkholderia gladioli BSR3]AJW95175.1 3-hydroxybutyrate dehydrogenase type 2 [Burkholderia gladioli]ASD82605.1 NAD(P)-dependent oxidoreductase [Burkholderia gladioli pv. gladioli]ATF90042.1 NAD(P)-dependent oxidoreductase [Burkholderia gladioli pv. gladioli]AWY50042.1 NAD(P)-dependent oxidoreductase [Burkholderia gladioli pv. gladioli]